MMKIERRIYTWLFILIIFLLYLFIFTAFGSKMLVENPKAMDFLAFYTGAKLFSHAPTNLYNLSLQHMYQQQWEPVIRNKAIFLPFLNPPFTAMVFQVLAVFDLLYAYVLFLGINIFLLCIICMLFLQQNKKLKWYYYVSFIIGAATFIPILINLLVGQLSLFLCVIFLLAWMCLKKGYEFRSGLIFSLLLIKPHFFILPLIVVLIQRRKKQIVGFILGTASLVIISWFYMGFVGLNMYLSVLNAFYQTGTGYNINIMAQQSLQTLLLILFHTQNLSQVRVWWYVAVLAVSMPTVIIWSHKFPNNSRLLTMQFAVLILATLLISPHTHFYDLSLLEVVSFLLLSSMNSCSHKQKKLIVTASILSYIVPWFGYYLFVVSSDIASGLWVIPQVVFLIIYWFLLFKEVLFSKNSASPKKV